MPDPDRIQELRRQRALVAEQLARLDREVAATSDAATPATPAAPAAPPPPASPPAPVSPQAGPIPAKAPERASIEADSLLEEYRVAPDDLKSDVKKGCFLYLAGAFVLLGLGITALYFIFRAGK